MDEENLALVIERLETLRTLLAISVGDEEPVSQEVSGLLDDIDQLIEEMNTFRPTLQ